jgi:toxin ParE1/3/4
VRRLKLSKDADTDLNDILAYGSVIFGDEVTRQYFFGFDEALRMLGEYPELAPRAWYLKGHVRCWSYRSHRIFYRFDDDTLHVGRILHHSMDVDRSLTI